MAAVCKVAVGFILLALYTRLLDASKCGQPGGLCYDIVTRQVTHSDAAAICNGRGATLAVVKDAKVQAELKALLEQNHLTKVWIGMEETQHMWRWVYDESIIAAQGCYWDRTDNRDLFVKANIPDGVNPEKCIAKCDDDGYPYAGVQDGNLCFCGHSFGKHGAAMDCDRECEIDSAISKWCGGSHENFVYYTKGGYGRWGYVEPSSHIGNERCAVIDTEIETKFGDETCFKTTGYICDIPHSRCTSGRGYHRINNRCYFMQLTRVTWYQAREECRVRGGDLVKVDDGGVHAELTKIVADNTRVHWQLWIGLTKGLWKWADGTRLVYANWAVDEPSRDKTNCGSRGVMMSSSAQYAWKVAACDSTAYVVCQTETPKTTPTKPTTTRTTTTITTTTPTPPTTAATTTAATTTTQITTSPSTTQATSPSTSPVTTTASPVTTAATTSGSNRTLQVGQSSGGATAARSEVGSTGLTYTEFGLLIFGLIVLLILLVILIIVCVYFCCCKKRNKVRSSCYDARPLALVPNDGYNTELFNSTLSLRTVGHKSISQGTACGHRSCPADNWHYY